MFPDADLEAAANGIIAGVFAATGQTCMAGSRLIVHEDVHDELIERVAERARTIVLGNPLEAATEMGPLANAQQFAKVTGILERALGARAPTAVCGGGPDPELGGYFVQPTILTGVGADNAGRARGDLRPGRRRDALPRRGRGDRQGQRHRVRARRRGVDARRAPRDARRQRLRAGTVWVNAYRVVGPNVPFGGFKAQRHRPRERARRAARVHRDASSIWIETSGATRDPFTLG